MDDVIVVGAGAAGLAGAGYLAAHGSRVRLLEGRGRVGGRVYSARFAGAATTAELGAEFVHGAPAELLRIFEERGIPFVDMADRHLVVGEGAPREAEFWNRVQRAAERLAKSSKDVPLSEALAKSWMSRETRELLRTFTEGFHAADPAEIGVRELGEAIGQEGELNGVSGFRPVGAYQKVLTEGFSGGAPVELRSAVQEIRQSEGAVEITVRDSDSGEVRRLVARAVLVTVPIAVLAAPPESPSGIKWDPYPACLRDALPALRTGHVSRLSLRFRSRFWEGLGGGEPVSFLHAAERMPYPTWWTLAPMRTNVLVAWQGGPCAIELNERGAAARLAIALRTLSRLTGREEKFLRAELLECLEHDWSGDPFSLGAYSYVACGGSAAAHRFHPGAGEGGVFFAGEATVNGPDRGTVHGAIRSGEEAAKACFAYLSREASSAA